MEIFKEIYPTVDGYFIIILINILAGIFVLIFNVIEAIKNRNKE